jgi:hypothetical protein
MVSKICPGDYEPEGKPRSFNLNGRKLVVDEVIDHWIEADCEYLRLLADDERIYLLLKHGEGDRWEVERVYGY